MGKQIGYIVPHSKRGLINKLLLAYPTTDKKIWVKKGIGQLYAIWYQTRKRRA